MLSKEFLWLILIAVMVSWPLAWYGIKAWLETFSKHINVQWFVYVVSALITLLLTLLVTSIHAYRASLMNPAETLKYE